MEFLTLIGKSVKKKKEHPSLPLLLFLASSCKKEKLNLCGKRKNQFQ